MNILVKNLSSGISIVQINDPKTYNSLSFKTLNDLIKVLKKLDQDKKTKVIIIEVLEKVLVQVITLKK